MNWAPNIPGTDIDRIEFLVKLQMMNREALVTHNLFKPQMIKELNDYGVLNGTQIAAVVQVSPSKCRAVLRELGTPPIGTGCKFHAGGIDGLLHITKTLANGKRPDKQLIAEATHYVGGVLMEKLTGVPNATYYRAKKRAVQ
jgi:hypothetical protein